MNLNGLCLLNTRPLDQGRELSDAIRQAGGVAIDLPALTIEPVAEHWLKNLPQLEHIDYAIFISANAVNYFYAALQQHGLTWPYQVENIAIGQASARALSKWKVRVDDVPTVANSEHLLQLSKLQCVKNKTILLVKGEGGRSDIATTLLTREAHIINLAVYRRSLPTTNASFVNALWQEEKVNIILLTSEQALQNIIKILGEKARAWLVNTPCLVISHRLAKAAYLLGMQNIIVCSYDRILEALEKYHQKRT